MKLQIQKAMQTLENGIKGSSDNKCMNLIQINTFKP